MDRVEGVMSPVAVQEAVGAAAEAEQMGTQPIRTGAERILMEEKAKERTAL